MANTKDGLAYARGRVGGHRLKLTEDQAALAQRLYDEREKTVQQIADNVRCPAVHGVRAPRQAQDRAPPAEEDGDHEALKATD